jgi:putative intracellular protease/amidase
VPTSALQPVSAVCHGPAALLSAVKPGTSEPLVKGVTVTGFSNDEEKQAPVDADKALPYWLETKMKELGATYVKADEPWGVKVVWDQGILTGKYGAKWSGAQRKSSSRGV